MYTVPTNSNAVILLLVVPLILLMKDEVSIPNFLWHFSVLCRRLFRPTVGRHFS